MSIVKRISHRLYYCYATLAVKKTKALLPPSMAEKKNVFIYFDYEREFGGHATTIDDGFILEILNKLDELKIKATWFTVGQIFEKYPDSIRSIVRSGHEVASHSYGHVAPKKMNNSELERDFQMFCQSSNNLADIKGFHSPQGRWSLSLIRFLCDNGYDYDMANTNRYIGTPIFVEYGGCSIVRLNSLTDDWHIYTGKLSENETFSFLLQKYEQIEKGQLFGIGFHPWILFEKRHIYNGFLRFIQFISASEGVQIRRADRYIEEILSFNVIVNE